MKKSLALLCLLLNLSSLVQSNCQNDLIARIKEHPESYIREIVLKTPATPSSYNFCRKSWTIKGTCCDSQLLGKALPQLLDNFTTETQLFVKELNVINDFVNKNKFSIVNRIVNLFDWVTKILESGSHKFSPDTIDILKK